jgi:hypothetical protein
MLRWRYALYWVPAPRHSSVDGLNFRSNVLILSTSGNETLLGVQSLAVTVSQSTGQCPDSARHIPTETINLARDLWRRK